MLQFLRIGGFIVESWRNSSTIDLTSTLPIQGTQVLWVGMRFFLCQKIEVTLIDVRRVLYGRVTITPLYICIYISWFMKFPVMRHGCEAVAWQWWSWNHGPVTRRAPFALKSAIPPPRRRVDFDGLIMAQVFRILKVIPWKFHLVRGKFPAPGLQQQFCWFTNARCYANRFIPGINKIRGISEDTHLPTGRMG